MTEDEFKAGPAYVLDGGWPGEFTKHDERAYFFLLDDYAEDQVMSALKVLARQKFRPSASEIITVLSPERAAVPTFDEMFTLLFTHRGALSKPEPAALERIAGMHPLVGSFVERQGVDYLKALPVHDPDDGHWRRKELHEAWDRHVEAFANREVAALASGSGLRVLDPLAGIRSPGVPALTEGEAK